MRSIGVALLVALLLGCGAPGFVAAQEPLQDNSFLIEEAYNQEAGVVQHISTFFRGPGGRDWMYSFTQEWPLGGMRHQFSYTLLLEHHEEFATTGPGDVLINYRYQLVGSTPEARLLVAPRLSLLLPTGNAGVGRGKGAAGVQANIPVTFMVAPSVATHYNAGLTLVPSARNPQGARATAVTPNLGASAVWLLTPLFNPMAELVWFGDRDVVGPGQTVSSNQAFLNPGVRWAFNLPGTLQITVGAAYAIGLTEASTDALFAYLSFEHPFRRETERR
jgi:hypothetical protein